MTTATAPKAATTSVTPVDCPVCEGSGLERVNVSYDASVDSWDYEERDCVACARTGKLPALEHYETSVLPSTGAMQWRCLHCECHVNPTQHLPGSEDCRSAYDERAYSMRDDEDPWGLS
jgi:hypothetical protein